MYLLMVIFTRWLLQYPHEKLQYLLNTGTFIVLHTQYKLFGPWKLATGIFVHTVRLGLP